MIEWKRFGRYMIVSIQELFNLYKITVIRLGMVTVIENQFVSLKKIGNSLISATKSSGPIIRKNEQEIYAKIMSSIRRKSIMHHHAQGLQQPVLIKFYLEEKSEFKKTLSVIHKLALPPKENLI